MSNPTYVTLPSGSKMPYVGLGLWKSTENVADVIEIAAKVGFRHFDSACDYGNEKEVGRGLKKVMENGIKREELFITSKLWNTYHRREHVLPALKQTLADLQLDYLDLFLIHFPIALEYVDINTRYPPEWTYEDPKVNKNAKMLPANVSYRETWEAMEELMSTGLVKNIGVSNLCCASLIDIFTYCKIPPAVNQFEIHPYLANTKLINYCQKLNVQVTGFSPFGPTSYVPIQPDAKNIPSLFDNEVILDIAKKYKKTSAQVLLRWQIERGCTVVPKSTREEKLKENINVFDFSLTSAEVSRITGLDKHLRLNDPGQFAKIPIWD